VHMAGPFAATSAPMLSACLATQTNYVDITGEIEVFEAMWSREEEIRRAGITAVQGAGFDVVPTDCLAAYVAGKLERPASLVIALPGAGKRISRDPAHRYSPGFETCVVPAGGSNRCPRRSVSSLDRFWLRR
jgi:saccharopine dehydrogenase-like NADP-dependent oxidoreductase